MRRESTSASFSTTSHRSTCAADKCWLAAHESRQRTWRDAYRQDLDPQAFLVLGYTDPDDAPVAFAGDPVTDTALDITLYEDPNDVAAYVTRYAEAKKYALSTAETILRLDKLMARQGSARGGRTEEIDEQWITGVPSWAAETTTSVSGQCTTLTALVMTRSEQGRAQVSSRR